MFLIRIRTYPTIQDYVILLSLSFKQIDIMTAFLDLALFFFLNGSFLAIRRREGLAVEKEWNENDGCLVPEL
jgi:hypothetical protein